MTKEAMPTLAEGSGVHSYEAITSNHLFVDNLMLQHNYKNTTEASLVGGVSFLLLQIS